MTCQSSSVPTTPMSASHVAMPTRSQRVRLPAGRRPEYLVQHRQRDDRRDDADDAEHHHGLFQQRRVT